MVGAVEGLCDPGNEALQVAFEYAGADGEHHKQWVIDQMVRCLTEDDDAYCQWVDDFTEDGVFPEWDEGIAP